MTTCPAWVPTEEEANPEASSATAKASAAPVPSWSPSPACTLSSDSMPSSAVNSWAAMTSIAAFTRPARPMASRTSSRWARSSRRRPWCVRPAVTTSP